MPITVEEFKELIKNPENAAVLTPIIKAAGFESLEDVQGLKDNRDLWQKQAIDWKGKYTDQDSKLKNKLDIHNLDEYIENKKTPSDGKTDDIKSNPEFRRLSSDFEELMNKNKSSESKYQRVLTDQKMSEALEAAGFKENKELMLRAFRNEAKTESIGDKDEIVFDNSKGVPMAASDYFKELASTEQWSRYTDKPENKGAGSQGINGGVGTGKTMKMSDFQKLQPKEQATFMKDGTLTD